MRCVSSRALACCGAAVAMVAALGTAAVVAAAPPGHAAPQAGAGYWHTSGNQITDAGGDPVRIAGVNWYGFETPDEVVHGLWAQDYHAVVDDIRNLGYNTIRIPFSNQMVETPVVPQNIGYYNSGPINTDLKNLNSLQILDKIIGYAGQDGLKVILDDHRSEAGESAEQNGLWYTSAYSDAAWVNDWATIAKRYAGNSTVIGFDLRNEPHTPAGVAYAQGATWGTGDASTDIRLAYQRAGNAVLAADPGALIFCEGISENPNTSGGVDSTWWGGDLVSAGANPVQLNSPGHVVYSAHDYGPDLFQQSWFNSSTSTASLESVWNKNWGYLSAQGTAPVWVGEFGTGNSATDVSDSTAGSQGQWFSSLVTYLHSNPAMGWTYWALNGEDSYALLDGNYDPAPANAAKQQDLATIEFPLSSGGGGPTPPPTSTPPASCSVSYSLSNAWAGGFQAQVVVTNSGSAAISGWTVRWAFAGDQEIDNAWNATVSQSGTAVTATNPSYDATIAPAGTASFGFTATYRSSNSAPTSFSVNGTPCD